jgi:hypothetical protein
VLKHKVPEAGMKKALQQGRSGFQGTEEPRQIRLSRNRFEVESEFPCNKASAGESLGDRSFRDNFGQVRQRGLSIETVEDN